MLEHLGEVYSWFRENSGQMDSLANKPHWMKPGKWMYPALNKRLIGDSQHGVYVEHEFIKECKMIAETSKDKGQKFIKEMLKGLLGLRVFKDTSYKHMPPKLKAALVGEYYCFILTLQVLHCSTFLAINLILSLFCFRLL
ncbi:uncharacterized protein LOC127749869 [Frankliniella occidentalis]|uniref:Uncharacterized protein LOC127749869 n=1 Tax=Frankliniella occidentalis TaxID=133901 RepID=A0A9C6U9C5_FRAOC|nr:uncharacterized protein LOC127749869 [Frankliniella occidentalis]